MKQWLNEGDAIRVVPYERTPEALIVSDVWLGNTLINKQFSNRKK